MRDTPREEIAPSAANGVRVQILSTTMRIHDLSIEHASIVGYLRSISPDKQEIALVHALEVGVNEVLARRERFRA